MSDLTLARHGLAEAIQALSVDLVHTDLTEAQVDAIRAQIGAARAAVEGSPRAPWWTHPGGSAGAAPEAPITSPFRKGENPMSPGLVFERASVDGAVAAIAARVTISALWQGPPHGVHGGVVAGLFDEVMGAVQRFVPDYGPAVTAKLAVRYRKLTPVDQELVITAWADAPRGRRLEVRAACCCGDEQTATAEALFVAVGGFGS